MQVRRLIQGTTPLLISIPHGGTFLPPDIKARLTDDGLRLPDTDWHLDRLYDFVAGMGAGVLQATHSRYVIDLNRPETDEGLYPGQVKTGLCPLETFDGATIYNDGDAFDEIERVNRIGAYWMPYHDALAAELQRIKNEFGFAILYDAHSIKSEVPRLFDGVLPDLNLGTVKGASCAPDIAADVMARMGDFSKVQDGRFIGGHITRHYGDPVNNIHALQMEIAQKNYMDEKTFRYLPERAEKLQTVLKDIIGYLASYQPAET